MKRTALAASIASLALLATCACAQTRTTPVSIDQNSNTVKAEQSGTWSVGINNVPLVGQSGQWNVQVQGTPSVNVSNTASVTVSNTPSVKIDRTGNTVGIDPLGNTVATVSKSLSTRPWSTDQTLNNNSWVYTPVIGCNGYERLRIMFAANSSSKSLQVHYLVMVPVTGGGGFERAVDIGYGTFGNTSGLTTNANFTQTTDVCSLDIPVMGEYCQIGIYNGTGAAVTIYHWSMVYLVH